MQKAQAHSSWLVVTIAIASFFSLAACEAQVIGGGTGGRGGNAATASNGSGGAGGNGQGGSGTAGGNPGSSNAISMLYSELKSSNPSGGTTVASSSGGGPDPNTLYIAISNTPEVCNDPFAAEVCGNHYRVSFGIPVALQKVGTIPLNDPTIISNSSFAGAVDGMGQCPFGGGSFWNGELQITAIDATHVAGILTNTDTFDFDANGVFDAPRCVF